jgi:hypothetical protein
MNRDPRHRLVREHDKAHIDFMYLTNVSPDV